MTIFVCKDEFDSILCGVYDAWMSGWDMRTSGL